jgi:hypothetical protein
VRCLVAALEDLLDKLAPLRPEDVSRWRRQLATVDERTRKLLEWKIHLTAREVLGTTDRLLLSRPAREACAGGLELGHAVYEKRLWPFALREAELLQHMAVFGRTGSGKSNLVLLLLRELGTAKVPFLAFDWKRGYRHALPLLGSKVELVTPGRSLLPFHFNPFACPPGTEGHVHIAAVVDLLAKAFTLGDGARSLLHRAITESGEAPTVSGILAKVEALDGTGRQGGWRASAVRCLQTLLFLDLVRPADQGATVASFFERSTILELNGMNENAKRFLVPAVLHWLYQIRLAAPDRERLRLVVVLEEAHNVLGDRQSEHFFGRFLRQCRELGIGVIIVDQAPSLMSSVALGNCYATVCLNLKDPSDLRVAGGLLQLSEKDRVRLSELPVGQAIVKLQDRWTQPFLIEVPHLPVEKGQMTDDRLRAHLAGQVESPATPPTPSNRSLELAHVDLEPGCFEFLLDVMQHSDDGVKERYARLGWSVDRGNRMKLVLVKTGLLEGQHVSVGRTRKLVIRPTTSGRRALGLEGISTAESIAHEFWKRRMAHEYEGGGWMVEVEALRDSARPELGRADLVLTKGAERWAVEVETGKSNAVGNVRNGLLAGLGRVLVVPVDEGARKAAERALATAGLLGGARVSLQEAT